MNKKTKTNGKANKAIAKTETPLPPAVIAPVGRGFEEPTQREDLTLPRAILLQALSPQLTDPNLKDLDLKAGMVVNNITNEQLPETFIPVFKYSEFLKFNPRDTKAETYDPAYEPGALIWRTSDPNDPRTAECKFGEDGAKPLAMKVMNFLCYFPGHPMPVVLGFSKTSFKAGKKLISLAQLSGGDMFSREYKLMVKQADKDGIKYFVLDVGLVGKANQEKFKVAEALYINFRGKELQVHETAPVEETEPEEML